MTTTLTERIDRWQSFMNDPATLRHLFWVNYPADDEPRPPLWPEFRQQRVGWILRKYERQVARLAWLHDDSLPHLDMLTGTEIFAEAFGCQVHRPDNDMPFALPLVHNAAEAERLRVPELSRSSLAYLFDMVEEMQRRLGHKALPRMVDVQSPMDIVALIWEKADLYPAMIESPDAVLALAAKVRELLCAFLDEWFRRFGPAFIAHYPLYYMERGVTLSEDEVGAVGTDAFDEFFLPELTFLSNRYGRLGMHCCANARHQWPGFARIPNLAMLNIVHNRQMITDARAFFAEKTPQIHSWNGDGPPETWPAQFPPQARMVIELTAKSPEEAKRLCEIMPAACRREAAPETAGSPASP